MSAIALARLCGGGADCCSQKNGSSKEYRGELHLEGNKLSSKPELSIREIERQSAGAAFQGFYREYQEMKENI
jgi:hypothetical protein